MFKEIDLDITDSLTAKHLILSNFGYLIANTVEKDILEKINLNMCYLTTYLISSEIIRKDELLEIVQKQTINRLPDSSYGVIKLYKGDELTEPSLLFKLSNLVSHLDKVLFTRRKDFFAFLKTDKWFRKNFSNKNVEEIYISFFDMHKDHNRYSNIVDSYEQIKVINELISNVINNVSLNDDKHYALYVEDDKDKIITRLNHEKMDFLNSLSKLVLDAKAFIHKKDIESLAVIVDDRIPGMILNESNDLKYLENDDKGSYISILHSEFVSKGALNTIDCTHTNKV